jgi:hypothetical protein
MPSPNRRSHRRSISELQFLPSAISHKAHAYILATLDLLQGDLPLQPPRMVSATSGIAIGEVVVFVPLFITALVVMFRHGFVKQMGWVYLLTFTLLSTIGAVLMLLSVHDPSNTKYQTWGTALSGAGLSPMSMAPIGLLSRV